MNKRHYQIFALTILVGAPLVVSGLSNVLPDDPAMQAEAAGERPDYLQPAVDPLANLPAALRAPPPSSGTSSAPPMIQAGAASLDPTPTFDPGGLAVTGADPLTPPPIVAAAPIAAAGPQSIVQQGPPPANARPQFGEGPIMAGH